MNLFKVRQNTIKKTLLFIILMLSQAVSRAADFNQGLTFYNNQDYQQAYKIWLEVVNEPRQLSNSLEWQTISTNEKINAQYAIGLLYWLGKGVKQDYSMAEQWLKKAATAGDKEASLKLGVLYLEGLLGKKDLVQAKSWLLKSANAGQSEAQYNLGLLFLQGLAGEKNLTQAEYWFKQAANLGDVAAKKQLMLLAKTGKNSVTVSSPPAATTSNSLKTTTETIVSNGENQPVSETTTIKPNESGVKNSGTYAIQVIALNNKAEVQNLMQLHPSADWQINDKTVKGKKFYVLVKCCFESVALANQAIQALPSALQKVKPFIIKNQQQQE